MSKGGLRAALLAWRPPAVQAYPGGPGEEAPVAEPTPAVETPLLDAYRAAKAAADANPGNPYLHFDYSALAEEGLALAAALEGANP